MTGWWVILLGYAWEMAAVLFFGVLAAAWWFGRGDNFSGAPTACDEDKRDKDDDAEDRGHDHYIDRRTGVSP